jgi:hypothetical protein
MFADGMRASTATETNSDSDSGTSDEEEGSLEIKKSKKKYFFSVDDAGSTQLGRALVVAWCVWGEW